MQQRFPNAVEDQGLKGRKRRYESRECRFGKKIIGDPRA
jgi:hypothetical protein